MYTHSARLLKVDGDGIHAVPLVGWVPEALVLEDMTEMAAALGTENFSSGSVGVRLLHNRVWNALIEGWPSAAGVELGLGCVQGRTASCAHKGALILLGIELVVLARARIFRACIRLPTNHTHTHNTKAHMTIYPS